MQKDVGIMLILHCTIGNGHIRRLHDPRICYAILAVYTLTDA